jgi:uncharacterized protein GlcG (DUF336 family)
LPGATDKDWVLTTSRGGTRWSAALTVVSKTDGRSLPRTRQPRQGDHPLRHDSGMRRSTIIRQAVPRKLEYRHVGRKEGESPRQRRHPWTVPADDDEAGRRRMAAGRHRAGEIGNDQPLGAVGDTRQRQRAAWFQQFGGRLRHQLASPLPAWKARSWRNSGPSCAVGTAASPVSHASNSPSGVHQVLKLGQLGVAQVRDMAVRKSTQNQNDLAQETMPGAEQEFAAADVQSFARTCRSAHSFLNAKSPDWPGGVSIAGAGGIVRVNRPPESEPAIRQRASSGLRKSAPHALPLSAASQLEVFMSAITLEQANRIIAAVLQRGAEIQCRPLSVLVVEPGCKVKAFQKEDGSSMIRFEMAFGKAYAALALGRSSKLVRIRADERPIFMRFLLSATDDQIFPEGGGLQIRDENGDVIGAIGVTGDTEDKDEELATYGIRAAGLKTDDDFKDIGRRSGVRLTNI